MRDDAFLFLRNTLDINHERIIWENMYQSLLFMWWSVSERTFKAGPSLLLCCNCNICYYSTHILSQKLANSWHWPALWCTDEPSFICKADFFFCFEVFYTQLILDHGKVKVTELQTGIWTDSLWVSKHKKYSSCILSVMLHGIKNKRILSLKREMKEKLVTFVQEVWQPSRRGVHLPAEDPECHEG